MTTQTTPPNGTTTQPTPPADPLANMQKRIDELTASITTDRERHREDVNVLIQQNQTLTQTLAERARQPVDAGPALPPLPVDPTDPTYAQALIAHAQAPLVKQLTEMQKTFNSAMGQLGGNQELMQLSSLVATEPPLVQQKATQLYHEAKAKGINGLSPQNYLWMARGMVPAAALLTRPNPNDAVTPGGSGMPPPPPRNNVPEKSDSELRAMTPEQRIAYYESRIGDDTEVVF